MFHTDFPVVHMADLTESDNVHSYTGGCHNHNSAKFQVPGFHHRFPSMSPPDRTPPVSHKYFYNI